MQSRIVGVLLVMTGVSAVACSSNVDEAGASEDGLSYACSIAGKQQGDGSKCEWDNCGQTSAAMMRQAMTCGSESYSGGQMRLYYDDEVFGGGTSCASHVDSNGNPAGVGSQPQLIGSLMEHISKYDHGPSYASTTTYYSSVSLATLKSRLSSGYVAVVPGGVEGGGPAAPCGFEGGHSIFADRYNPTTDEFHVYDPCCSSTCTSHFNGKKSPQWWPAASLENWRWSAATIGKGASPAPAGVTCGTNKCPAGDFCGPQNHCCNPNVCSMGCPC